MSSRIYILLFSFVFILTSAAQQAVIKDCSRFRSRNTEGGKDEEIILLFSDGTFIRGGIRADFEKLDCKAWYSCGTWFVDRLVVNCRPFPQLPDYSVVSGQLQKHFTLKLEQALLLQYFGSPQPESFATDYSIHGQKLRDLKTGRLYSNE